MENEDIREEAEDKAVRIYEIGYHILPTVSEEELPGEVGNVKELVESNGGLFISEDFPKLRQLAYSISKNIDGRKQDFDKAYFGWVKFEIDPEKIATIKKGLEGNKNILRFLIIETVRENTMSYLKPPTVRKDEEDLATPAEERVEKREEITAEDEERISKSIDELVKE